jgi:peptidoglycan/xylan/chitin deacetylase (PgdA/CDA1 family)
MLTFRNTSVAFLVMLVFAAMLSTFWPDGFIILLVIGISYLSLLVFGSVFVSSGFYLKAFCKGKGDEKKIAISFDDGPDPDVTPELLDLLGEIRIKAAFFCIGKKVEGHREILARMVKEGHLVGNHSYSHSPFFDLKSSGQMAMDLGMAEMAITTATGTRPVWFRPPYGVTNPMLARAVNARGYKVMGWSIRSLDTSIKDPEKIMARIRKRWKPGAIILLHDTDKKVLTVVRMIIEEAGKRGYEIVRGDEMLVMSDE